MGAHIKRAVGLLENVAEEQLVEKSIFMRDKVLPIFIHFPFFPSRHATTKSLGWTLPRGVSSEEDIVKIVAFSSSL